MKIEKYEKTGQDKYRLYLDNGEVIDTYDKVILKNSLLIKKEISSTLYQKILEQTKTEEFYYKAVKYISFRIRSQKEIYNYLKKNNASDEEIEIVINELNKDNLLNDEYFAKCFIKDKINFTNMGKYRIIQELKKHNITDFNIDEYFTDEMMKERITKIIEKKIKSNKNNDIMKIRNQLYNNLFNLGYPTNLIIDKLNHYFN